MAPIFETDTGRERLRILRAIGEGASARLEGEVFVEPGGGPPMHVHWHQEEGFRVISGRLGYQLAGEEPRYLGPGEEAVFQRGVAHRFWNAGEGLLHTEAWVSPAGNFAWFITRLHASIAENGGEKPGLFDGAFLLTHFASEYDIVDIPSPVKNVAFPLVVALGRLLGKYRKYADAPEPIRARPATPPAQSLTAAM